MNSLAKEEQHNFLKYSFWLLVLIRGFFNAVIPLMDKTKRLDASYLEHSSNLSLRPYNDTEMT